MSIEKKFPERKRFFGLDLNKWYTYEGKNEKSTLTLSFGTYNTTIWINERSINNVTPNSRTMVTLDNLMLYEIFYYFKSVMKDIKTEKHRVDILSQDKGAKTRTLKLSLVFGKNEMGYMLGCLIPHKQSILFPLIPNEKYVEIKIYNNSDQVIKSLVSEGYAEGYLTSVLDILKDSLKNKLFNNSDEKMIYVEGKEESASQTKTESTDKVIEEVKTEEKSSTDKNTLDDMTKFMDEMGAFDNPVPEKTKTLDDLDELAF